MIAFFAGPSFHEGSASCDSAVPATITSTATNTNKMDQIFVLYLIFFLLSPYIPFNHFENL